jgi:hypothetical protein
VLASMCLGDDGGGGADWRGMGLMQLLKRASKRRGSAAASSPTSATTPTADAASAAVATVDASAPFAASAPTGASEGFRDWGARDVGPAERSAMERHDC